MSGWPAIASGVIYALQEGPYVVHHVQDAEDPEEGVFSWHEALVEDCALCVQQAWLDQENRKGKP